MTINQKVKTGSVMKNNKNKQHKRYSRGGDKFSDRSNKREVIFRPLEVKVYDGNFDRALKAFRSLVQKERILSIYKERQSYEKPSDKKRRKKNEAKRKMMELEKQERELKAQE